MTVSHAQHYVNVTGHDLIEIRIFTKRVVHNEEILIIIKDYNHASWALFTIML